MVFGAINNTSSSTACNTHISSDVLLGIADNYGFSANTDSTYSRMTSIIPITKYLYIDITTGKASKSNFTVWGYRRIGTNI